MKTENNIKFATKEIPLTEIEVNEGQIPELPRNPRIIKDERFDALKKSIKENPEMLALREIIVVPHDGKFVAIGGNMRLLAMRELKFKAAPCKVVPESVPAETLRAYAIKDNIAFGELDWDALANECDMEELAKFGLELDGLTEELEGKQTQEFRENPYTQDVSKTLQYEPTGIPVDLRDAINIEKAKKLIESIKKCECFTKNEKELLIAAAWRFAEINFEMVAEFYSNANAEQQKIMESLALVVIDYEDAVKNGFVKLVENVHDAIEGDVDDE